MTLTWPDKKDGCMKSSWTQLLEIDSQKLVNSLLTNPKAHKLAGEVGKSIENKFEEELKKLRYGFLDLIILVKLPKCVSLPMFNIIL